MKVNSLKKETKHDKWKRAGLVQLTVWVPSLCKGSIMDQCEKLRRDYLRGISFDKNFGDEE